MYTNTDHRLLRVVLLQKLIVAKLVKKLPAFIEPEDYLPCSQQPVTGPYPESVHASHTISDPF